MLDDLILPEHMKDLAGAAAFKRGENYFRGGRVETVVDEEDWVAGTVEGSEREPYRASLQAAGDELAWDCSCPVGDQGDFCKHLVALALARLASGEEPASEPVQAGGAKMKRRGKEEEIRAFLEGQDKARLVEWLLEVARWDRATRERLLLAARAGGPSAELKKLITDVTRVRDFLDYGEVSEFARRAHGMIDTLEGQHGAALMELAEYAVERLHKALESCDDSDGHMGGLLDRLMQLHARACAEARPEPEGFARWLFERQMADEWGTWPGAEAYRDILGETGMAEYARLAGAAWDRLPALGPGQTRETDSKRYRITHIMEALARQSGEPERLVEVLKKDLSHSYAFLRIAEVWRDAGRHDAALDWAERGMAAFVKQPDGRIEDFLVEEYFRRQREDDAMAVAWAQYARNGGFEGYKKVIQRARQTPDVNAWRERALAALREAAVQHHAQFRPMFGPRPEGADFTALVQALLWDKDLDAALAEARAGLCNAHTLVDLARALAADHPEDAISLYRRAVHPIVELKKNDAYAEAAGVVHAVRDLAKKQGREREFADWLAELRRAHKPKRNFMKLLDAL